MRVLFTGTLPEALLTSDLERGGVRLLVHKLVLRQFEAAPLVSRSADEIELGPEGQLNPVRGWEVSAVANSASLGTAVVGALWQDPFGAFEGKWKKRKRWVQEGVRLSGVL